MLQPQNPWETGELAGLMSLPKEQGEIINTWSVGVGFEHFLVPFLRGKVDPQRYFQTIDQLNHITRKENIYNYLYALLLLVFVVPPIGYYFFFADILRNAENKEVIVLHDTVMMAITYFIVACDVPALLYVAYLGYAKEQNEIHSLSHCLLIIVAFGNTIAYPFALKFIHAENRPLIFLLYPLVFPFLALLSIFINRRLPELMGEAKQFIEKENVEYYHDKGVTLQLRPDLGDRLYLVISLSSTYDSAGKTTREQQEV
jgi:hypothetical protein